MCRMNTQLDKDGWVDGWMDGWMDGWTRWVDGQTDG